MARDDSVIQVSFIDAGTGQVFARSDVPIAQLPQSFAAATTMYLGDQEWQVVAACPQTEAEFRQSGQLDLRLRKVDDPEVMDPGRILFSLPTITDEIPPVRGSRVGQNVIEMHEDDWRQVEWVTGSALDAVEREMAAIRRVYAADRQGAGFTRTHLRKLRTPLDGVPLRLDDLKTALGPEATWLHGVTFTGMTGVVGDSFAVRLKSSIELVGLTAGGTLQAICFTARRTAGGAGEDTRRLSALAASRGLILVDWCAVLTVPSGQAAYEDYFAHQLSLEE